MRTLTIVLIAVVLVCVPAFTRVNERACSHHTSAAFRFSKGIEKPPDRVNPIQHAVPADRASYLDPPPLVVDRQPVVYEAVRASTPRTAPRALRAPPPADAVHV